MPNSRISVLVVALFIAHLFGSVKTTTEPPHDAVTGNYDSHAIPEELSEQERPLCNLSGEGGGTHPDLYSDCPTMIRKYGYDLQTLEVTTEDGYILTMFRISGSPSSPKRWTQPGKIPVFLKHGLQGNCMSWLFLPGNQSLAFKLADAGYDVYLGNSRGTEYSRKHTFLDPKSDAYWNFSFQELGIYDIPAQIDLILEISGHKDIYYIGHSLGSAEYMICMSERPKYGLKIRVGFLLAPAGKISDMTSPGITTILRAGTTSLAIWKLEHGNYLDVKLLTSVFPLQVLLCPEVVKKCGLCNNPLYYAFGHTAQNVDSATGQFYSAKYFDTTSSKLLCHVSQVFHSGELKKFDYKNGFTNIEEYGLSSPPFFKLNKIVAPTVAYWALGDTTTPPEGVKQTLADFAPGIIKENNRVQDKFFDHLDFVLGRDANKLIYNRIQYIMDNGMYLE